MAVNLSPYGGVGAQFLDNSGNVLTGGKIFTYAAGTTTPQASYINSTGAIPHSNPIILDASGRVPGGEIWLTDGLNYKFVLTDSNNVLIATYDNVAGINSNFVNFVNQQEIQTATAGQTVFNLNTVNYTPATNSLSVFVDGVNQYGPGAQYAYLETDSDTVTFVNGLHVGASVKFTTSQLNSSGAADASQVSYDPPFANSVLTTVEDKLAQTVSVKDFGAVGDGVTDDTSAIQAALSASYHVTIPAGMTCLVSASITVPNKTRLEFLGGLGNSQGAMPASYLIMDSTMTTPAIIISERGTVDGGGVLGQVGNTGDGVQLAGNSATLRNHIVCQAGRDGVRVGTDGVYANCNSTVLEYVKAKNNGRHGFYIHDGVSVGPADANAGTLLQCEADDNGADGIRLGHCFWVSVINCLTEVNTGYGLYLSGIGNATYPECRWATIVGGDFNEGNNSTVNVDQVYDSSYFSTFINPDSNQFPTNTTTTGLQGAGVRSQYGAASKTSFYGGTFYTSANNEHPVSIDGGASGTTFNGLTLRKKTTGTNGNGIGLGWSISSGGTNPYVQAGEIKVTQNTTDQYGMTFNVYRNGALPAMEINANAYTFRPLTDNTWSLGSSGFRWYVVYAATGIINTSDARAKNTIAELTLSEQAVARKLKTLVRTFKLNDNRQKTHVGVIAQDVVAAFESEGLDPMNYAIVDYSEDCYGVRYDQLLAFIIGAM